MLLRAAAQIVGLVSVIVCLGGATLVKASPAEASQTAQQNMTPADLDSALRLQKQRAATLMALNISPADGLPGSVIASPSRTSPPYYFHWLRDSALTMEAVLQLYQTQSSPKQKTALLQALKDFVSFSRLTQLVHTASDLGEPKFNLDGTAYTGPWARPQNDGPALRAVTLIHLARVLLRAGDGGYVHDHLYAVELPTTTVIKTDLEYVAHHWQDPSFDLWEEIEGDQFYTRMVQRRALLEGADLAEQLGDSGAASFYRTQAALIVPELQKHWDPSRSILQATLNRVAGIDYKFSGLDTAVVLAALHGGMNDGVFTATDDKILATAAQLEKSFGGLYGINEKSAGVVIGRYPEDRYDGFSTSEGNPWFICTLALAELSYRAANGFANQGYIAITPLNAGYFRMLKTNSSLDLKPGIQIVSKDPKFAAILTELTAQGDAFMQAVLDHVNQQSGSMAEEMNRDSGFMTGASDLTWSYVSFLTAEWYRESIAPQLFSHH